MRLRRVWWPGKPAAAAAEAGSARRGWESERRRRPWASSSSLHNLRLSAAAPSPADVRLLQSAVRACEKRAMPMGLRRTGSYSVAAGMGNGGLASAEEQRPKLGSLKSRRRLPSLSGLSSPSLMRTPTLRRRPTSEMGALTASSLRGRFTPNQHFSPAQPPAASPAQPDSQRRLVRTYAQYLRHMYALEPPPRLSGLTPPPHKTLKDSFVNSQEWTMSRSVADLKLGVVGGAGSGKTSLVHRYLTGSYMPEESPEGGRFKKELVLEGQSYLLLIRDEGGLPEAQFSEWVDAVILVFSLENEASFSQIQAYYQRLAQYRHPRAMPPLVLVGTQDAISDAHPRLVHDSAARDLAARLPRCSYLETCATYGLNVDKVFREACAKILAKPKASPTPPLPPPPQSCPSTPNHNHHDPYVYRNGRGSVVVPVGGPSPSPSTHSVQHSASSAAILPNHHHYYGTNQATPSRPHDPRAARLSHSGLPTDPRLPPEPRQSTAAAHDPDFAAPALTPNPPRKNLHSTSRRISNIFRGPREAEARNGAWLPPESLGSGRAIPLKQGILYKRANKTLNAKEWKKKYFTLHSDGRLVYHANLKDYMDDEGGKEIFLGLATVKLPAKPAAKRRLHPPAAVGSAGAAPRHHTQPISLSEDPATGDSASLLAASGGEADSAGTARPAPDATPGAGRRKRHSRKPSQAKTASDDGEDGEACEFMVVSSNEKQWQLEAESGAERDEWVRAIQEQIGKSLEGQVSQKVVAGSGAAAFRSRPGNERCADCGAPEPAWASLNLGALLCIECSGIHRQLGAHVSRVRSLDLDEWPPEYVRVMAALGNRAVNSLWEAAAPAALRPAPDAPRPVKEDWIRRKYQAAEFKRPLTLLAATRPLLAQLVDAVVSVDVAEVVGVLAEASRLGQAAVVNAPVGPADRRTVLHLAASSGSPEVVQMLVWHSADVAALDSDRHRPLWFAEQVGGGSGSLCTAILRTAAAAPPHSATSSQSSSLH